MTTRRSLLSGGASGLAGVALPGLWPSVSRAARPIADRTFEIQFLDPGVQAYAFTFG